VAIFLAVRGFLAGRRVCVTVGRFDVAFARVTFLTRLGRLAFLAWVVRRFTTSKVSCTLATYVKYEVLCPA
jgi:hypothetical protein